MLFRTKEYIFSLFLLFVVCISCSEYSMQLNASRIKVLQAQDDIVGNMKEEASKELLHVSHDHHVYSKLLKDLIVQVCENICLLTSWSWLSGSDHFGNVNCFCLWMISSSAWSNELCITYRYFQGNDCTLFCYEKKGSFKSMHITSQIHQVICQGFTNCI